MTISGMEAWVTSAVEEKDVDKALLLARSIRKVLSCKKLAVLTSFDVSKDGRDKLGNTFDLVHILEPTTHLNGLSQEDRAKVEGFALVIFNKCVYLSPNTMVLKNFDDIFDKYDKFAMGGNGNELDSSVYLFTPGMEHRQALEKIMHPGNTTGKMEAGSFGSCFNLWIKNNVSKFEKLDDEYNVTLNLRGRSPKGLGSGATVTIVNFGDAHPLDLAGEDFMNPEELGTIEQFVVEQFRNFEMEYATSKSSAYSDLSLQREYFKTEPIAIVGMSFRLPGATNVRDFWELLINGREAIIPLPESRWLPEYIPAAYTTRKVEAGFLTDPVDEFDAKFFGISGKEAEYMDPQHRLLHEVAWEALEDAMLDPHTLRGTKTGIFVGSWLQDYMNIVNQSMDKDFFRGFMGTSIGSGAARLSHFFQTVGPSIATESGCSSAMVAVDMACKSLRNRDSNLALACGVNLLLGPFDVNTLSFVVSPEGRCRTFDESADGFGRAEGCAVLILKRLSDATRDGDNIWGLVRGSAVVQEGTSTSFGTPTAQCESLAMELALNDAHVNPLDVSYVEAHGTGTPVGDPLEIAAITKAYSKSGRLEPLVIGSVKTNVGHTESVSGLTGIIKVLLSMRNGMIPQHLNLKKLNPAINLDVIPAKIPLEAMPWETTNDKPKIAGVSSFGINGTDGHAIIQEAPTLSHPQIICSEVTPRPLHVMKISARSQESFDELLRTYEHMFSSSDAMDWNLKFEDIAYSANTGRATFNNRAFIIAKDFKEAANVIKTKSFKSAEVQSTGSKLCFLFTGQGSQYPYMGAELYKTSPVFRDAFNTCDQILVKRYGIHLPEVLWGQLNDSSELNRTIYSQTSIFCIEYCLFKLWSSWGVKPDFVMGHSLGEFPAAVAAGILDFEDALMLVAERSRLIDNLPRGKMLVIQANKDAVHQTIQKYKQLNPSFWVDYAAINSPDQTVVAGDSEMIEEFAQYCGSKSLKTTVLAATHAFHSRHMDPMLESYRKIASTLKKVEVGDTSGPKYVSGMEGKIIDLESINVDYWVRHTREPVNFIEACKSIHAEECSRFLEVGPHPVLSALVMGNMDGQNVTCWSSLRKKHEDWSTLLDSLTKLYLSDWKGQVDWMGFDRYYKRTRTPLPFYPFNRKPAWKRLEASLPNIHPLLGKGTPTGCEHTIFENRITLKNIPFVKDHVIGNTVVFPGAAFMEMCLAGGHATVQGSFNGELLKPRRAVALRSLRIVSPLGLFDEGIYRLQTTSKLDMEEDGEIRYNIGVDRYVPLGTSGTGEWISQATAKFLPVPPPWKGESASIGIDIQAIQNTWESTDLTPFYNRLPEVGLRFGPKFQSLEMGWKSEMGILLSVKLPEDKNAKYLIHPIVADAMIQATMLWVGKDMLDKIKLQVPVQIGEFIWLEGSTSAILYIYCETNTEGKTESILLDEQGTLLARMSGVDFIETTVKLMEGMIQRQGSTITNIYREVWKSSPGPLQRSYDFKATAGVPLLQFTDEEQEFLDKRNDIGQYEWEFYNNVSNHSRLYFVKAMYELGWKPEQRTPFNSEELISLLPKPEEHFKRYIRFFLQALQDAGMITRGDDDNKVEFCFPEPTPTLQEMEKNLQHAVSPKDSSRVEYQLVSKVGSHLAKLWRGEVEPLQLLFPEDPSMPSAGRFYDAEAAWVLESTLKIFDPLFGGIVDPSYNACMDINPNFQPILRVLEVGSGTGAFSLHFLEQLALWGKPFVFYYTDISPSFFSGAEIRLAKHLSHVIFKKFDMEEDPFAQGFSPNYFDVVMAGEVLHVAKDIRKTLGNINSLLKPGGIIQIIETTVPDLRITQIFGILEGYWGFQDLDFRPYHATLTPAKWEEALRWANFDKVVTTPVYNNCKSIITAQSSLAGRSNVNPNPSLDRPKNSWLIFYPGSFENLAQQLKDKLVGVNRNVRIVRRPLTCTEEEIKTLMKTELHFGESDGEKLEGIIYLWGLPDETGSREQCQVSLPLLSLVHEMTECTAPPRLYVITQGTVIVDGSELTNPTSGTLFGMIKSLSNEVIKLHMSCIDLSPDDPVLTQADAIFCDLWSTDKSNVAFRGNERLIPKFVTTKVNHNEPLPLPSGFDRFQLALPKTRVIADLEFGVLDKYTLGETEVEVQVKAMALNFRDVFTVLKPIPQFEEINSVGFDFAGVVSKAGDKVGTFKLGDRVIGINMDNNLSLPSHIKIDEECLVHIPSSMTFSEGVTLPAVFLTGYLCLIDIAKMKSGETILIHTATGGVGLCAIQLAKMMGVEIVATAGSKRKQNYLRNLGIKHVFHSRTTDFGKEILDATNGRGVDIVLNSITGEGYKEASLSALAKNGRFIEMSKLNVWKPEEVKKLRPDAFYKVVDLTATGKEAILKLINQLKEFLFSNNIQPIPYEQFDALNIRGALGYLQKAKHIGKIVCMMPEAKIENSKIKTTTPLFNEMSTYLVTGGLGGIGFEVVKWMLNSGAKHVAIVSRSSPKPEVATMIQSWNKSGKHVEAFPVDIGDYGQCLELFQNLKSPGSGFPQLRGVMHAAGVLADAILENQNWNKFDQTYNPKVNGSWNLHDLTKELQLEHFVLFSSMAASFGSPGQSNHSASNCFEDSLAAYRRSNGLPATSVNWGNWGEVGVATELDFPGIRPISTSQGLLTLETMLKTQESHLCACNIDSFALAVQLFPSLKSYVDDKRLFGDMKADFIFSSDDFWKEVDEEEDREGKLLAFKNLIKLNLRVILKMSQDEVIDDLTDFQSLGVDSLMMLEMKNGLQNILGSRMTLTANELKDCTNTDALANRLVGNLLGEWAHVRNILPTMEKLQELLEEDSLLPEHIRPSDGREAGLVSEAETVLLTGATGSLGPYILRELSNRPGIKKIICLVRKFGKVSPMDRLVQRLKVVHLEKLVDLSKVECIRGDVVQDKFGLLESEYSRLAGSVDTVFNSAVRADHTAKYYKAPESMKQDLRNVNVKGTLRILEFAVHTKLKHVFQGSSLLSVFTTEEDDQREEDDCYDMENERGFVSEKWQEEDILDHLPYNLGYPLSKHISENLCRQAVERGIPCKTFRFPVVGGDSRNGRCDFRGNHIILRWLTFLKLKCVPDMVSPIMIIPVDHCAQLSLEVFFNNAALADIYNVSHLNSGVEDQIMVKIGEELGIPVETLTMHQFIDRLKLEGDDSPLAPFMKLYREDEEELFELLEENSIISSLTKIAEESKQFFKSRKLEQLMGNYSERYEPSEVVIRRDLSFLKECGAFEKFGIK